VRVLWFGTYSVGPGYPRNTVLIEGLRAAGVEVAECHVPLFRGAADKVATAATAGGLLRAGVRAALAWLRLAGRFFRAGPRDAVVVGYTGHADVYLARALSVAWRRPIVLDAFLSPWDTVVNDRRLLAPTSRRARLLFALERNALRLADLVLTDTAAHADFMAQTFGVDRRRFVPVPVGSLVRAAAPARVPVAVGGGGAEEPRPFTAFFCGSFVPLQGVPYILDAAERAPDLRFELVGDGPGGPDIEREVRARGLPNVSLERRFIPREELEARLAAADAVLGVFGATAQLFNMFGRYGVQTSFVPLADPAAWDAAVRPETRMFYLETPSNPLTEVADLAAISEVARRHGVALVVDNCFSTPALQQPLSQGADIVVHSATKYIDGQGRVLGGAVLGSRKLIDETLLPVLRTAGPTLSAFNAWVLLKGLETLAIRMERQCASALEIACISMVLPARGGDTISPRCPLPSGAIRSSTRPETSAPGISTLSRSSGWSGVSLSKRMRPREASGGLPLTESTRASAKRCGG